MLRTILLFCLLAFSTAQAKIWYCPDNGDQYYSANIQTALDSLDTYGANGDTIYVWDDVTSTATQKTRSASGTIKQPVTIMADPNRPRPTYTMTGLDSASVYIQFGTNSHGMIISGIDFVVDNDNMDGGVFQFYGTDGDTNFVSHCSFEAGGYGDIGAVMIGKSDVPRAIDIQISDCDFTGTSASTNGLICVVDAGGAMDISDCTFTGGKRGIGTRYNLTLTGMTVDGCTFTDLTSEGLKSAHGGYFTVQNSTFTNTTSGNGDIIGLDAATHPDSTHAVYVLNSTFTNARVNIGYGTTSTQPVNTGSVSNCTFPADSSVYDIQCRTVGTTINGNTFYGSQCLNYHCIMLGSDSGYEVGDSLAINVYGNTLTQTTRPPAAGTLSYLFIVNKSNYNNIYNNTFTAIEPLTGSDGNAAIISCPGGQYIDFYNNTITANNSLLQLMRLLNWTTTDVTDFTAYNNIFSGTYADIVKMEHDDMTTNMVVDHNYFGGGVNFDSLGVDVDGNESAWYGSFNTTDSASWILELGGQAGLTGTTATPSGFVSLGATQRSTDPVINLNQAGFETPVQAFLRCRDMGLTGVELDWYIHGTGKADALNMDNWLNGTGATGDGTTSGSTWEAQAFDTLRVGRVR